MYERFTEKARRILFFARYEASLSGIPYIDARHLLLGLMREDAKAIRLLLKSPNSPAAIRDEIERGFQPAERISTSIDLPLGEEAKLVLHRAAEESQQLQHASIDTGHLLLGLLQTESTAEILRRHGAELEEARKHIALFAVTSPTSPPEPAAPVQTPAPAEFSREDLRQLIDELPRSALDTVGRLLKLLTGRA